MICPVVPDGISVEWLKSNVRVTCIGVVMVYVPMDRVHPGVLIQVWMVADCDHASIGSKNRIRAAIFFTS